MKIVKPSVQAIKESNPYKLVERVGRICYKSEDKITDDSFKKFIEMLMRRKHYAMLEHSNVIIQVNEEAYRELKNNFDTKFIRMTEANGIFVVSGSFRAWRELLTGRDCSFILVALQQKYPTIFQDIFEITYPTGIPEKNLEILLFYLENYANISIIDEDTVKSLYKDASHCIMEHIVHSIHFVCDRGVSHEIVRHRPCGFAQESTRYCNYSQDKFGNEITVIEPLFFPKGSDRYVEWESGTKFAEDHYFDLLSLGATPQEARTVLPNSLKTEIVVTANEKEWQHILCLRYHGLTGAPHPQMKEVMNIAYPILVEESEGRLK